MFQWSQGKPDLQRTAASTGTRQDSVDMVWPCGFSHAATLHLPGINRSAVVLVAGSERYETAISDVAHSPIDAGRTRNIVSYYTGK